MVPLRLVGGPEHTSNRTSLRAIIRTRRDVRPHRLAAAADELRLERGEAEAITRRGARRVRDEHRYADALGEPLDPVGQVHGVADDGVLAPERRADVAEDHAAGVEAH